MSSTAPLTCADGWTPPTSPSSGVATRPSYSLQVNVGGTGKVRDIRLEGGYSAKQLVIFSAGSASSSIAYLRLVSLGSGSPNHDGVSELKGRGYVPQSLDCLAGASNGERTETKDSTENGLAHVH